MTTPASSQTTSTESGPADYSWLFDAMLAVARSAPERPHANVHAAKVPWSKLTELRDALDELGIDWRD